MSRTSSYPNVIGLEQDRCLAFLHVFRYTRRDEIAGEIVEGVGVLFDCVMKQLPKHR